MEKRLSPRVPTALEVLYVVDPPFRPELPAQEPPAPKPIRGRLEDVSSGGCRLRTEELLKDRQFVKIQVSLPEQADVSLPFLAEVRWAKAVSSHEEPGTEDPAPQTAAQGARSMSFLTSLLTEDESDEVVKRLQRPRVIPPGAVIVEEGAESDYSLYIITRGLAKVTTRRQGKEIVLGALRENDVYGEITFFTKGRRSATITTILETEVVELKEADLVALIQRYPHIGDVLKAFYKARVAQTVDTLPIYVAGCRFLV